MIPPQLGRTAAMLRELLSGVTPDQMQWKPAPDRFSIAEVLAHLADAEVNAYAKKYALFASDGEPDLEPYDTDGAVARGDYAGKDPLQSLAWFEERRAANLARLSGLRDRTLRHTKVGPISLSNLLNEVAYHDLGHVRQVAELVRALLYYPNMGAYANYYKPNP